MACALEKADATMIKFQFTETVSGLCMHITQMVIFTYLLIYDGVEMRVHVYLNHIETGQTGSGHMYIYIYIFKQ